MEAQEGLARESQLERVPKIQDLLVSKPVHRHPGSRDPLAIEKEVVDVGVHGRVSLLACAGFHPLPRQPRLELRASLLVDLSGHGSYFAMLQVVSVQGVVAGLDRASR